MRAAQGEAYLICSKGKTEVGKIGARDRGLVSSHPYNRNAIVHVGRGEEADFGEKKNQRVRAGRGERSFSCAARSRKGERGCPGERLKMNLSKKAIIERILLFAWGGRAGEKMGLTVEKCSVGTCHGLFCL